MMWSLIAVGVSGVALTVFMIGLGLRVLLTRRAVFVPSRIYFAIMVVAFAPTMISQAQLGLFDADHHSVMGSASVVSLLMYAALLVFLWVQMRGFMCVGIVDDSLRAALHASLKKRDLPFEEVLSKIKLPTVGAELQVSIQSWIGVAQLRMKGGAGAPKLKELVRDINDYYKANSIPAKVVTAVFYLVTGVMLVGIMGAVAWTVLSLKPPH